MRKLVIHKPRLRIKKYGLSYFHVGFGHKSPPQGLQTQVLNVSTLFAKRASQLKQ